MPPPHGCASLWPGLLLLSSAPPHHAADPLPSPSSSMADMQAATPPAHGPVDDCDACNIVFDWSYDSDAEPDISAAQAQVRLGSFGPRGYRVTSCACYSRLPRCLLLPRVYACMYPLRLSASSLCSPSQERAKRTQRALSLVRQPLAASY